MSTITLPNIRVSSDLTVGVVLKDGGVAIDWSTLSNIKAYLYADAQRAMAGRCSVSVDEEDATRLVCSYRANKPQYIGVNRIVITCTYRGETKTFDKPALNFVRWTDDQAGQQITIDDPDVDVEIEVEDVSSSILEQAIAAALQAAADAEHAAHLIPNQVLLDCEQATAGANAAAEAANAAGITSVNVSVEDNEPGTPSAECTLANKVLSVIFHYLKGETGDAAGFGTINASFVEDGGDPSVVVTTSGPDTAKNISFTLKNFKGDKGDKGDQGNTGSSVDYPFELVNNETTDDATKAHTAAGAKRLKDELSQLELKVDELEDDIFVGNAIYLPLSSTTNIRPGSNGIITTQYSGYTRLATVRAGQSLTINFTIESGKYLRYGYTAQYPTNGMAVVGYGEKNSTVHQATTTAPIDGYLVMECGSDFTAISVTMDNTDTIGRKVYELEQLTPDIAEAKDGIAYLEGRKVDAGMFYGSQGPTNLLYLYPAVSGYLSSQGSITENNTYRTGIFIEVSPNTAYALSYIRFSLQYDKDKNAISASYTDHNSAASDTITTGATVKYIRVTYETAKANKAQVVKGNSVPDYSDYSVLVPYLRVLYKNVEDVSVPVANISGAIPSSNLFNKNNVVVGYLGADGSVSSNNSYRTSLFIPVDSSKKYSFAYARFIVEYDKSMAVVPGTYVDKNHAASSNITTSASTKYIRVTYQTTNVYKAQMAEGDTLPPYEDFGFTLKEIAYPKSKYQGKKIVCFGDSITACVADQDNSNWCMYLKNATGVVAINQGYWSARLAYADDAPAVVNSFALYKLIDAVISGDWSDQDIIYETSGYEGHAAQLDKLKQIDFSEIDFVSIALGTNDLASETPFEISGQPLSVESVNGALRYCISKLLTNFPHLQIFIMTPVYRFTPSTGEDVLYGGRGIQDFVDDYKELGAELRIPVCNMFNDIGVNKWNREYYWGENGGDGLHPIATMKRVMGNKVAGFLISTY